jgi:hypothetical protein
VTYVAHDIDLSGHPKLLRLTAGLARTLDLPPGFLVDPAAIAEGLVTRLWCWCMKYADDGDLSTFDHDEVALAVGWRGDPDMFFEILTKSGFLDADGSAIHDWEDYAGKLVRRRKANAKRMKKARDDARLAEGEDGASAHGVEHVQDTCGARAAHVQSERIGSERNGTDHSDRALARVAPVDSPPLAGQGLEGDIKAKGRPGGRPKSKSAPTCDGEPCRIRELRCDIRRDVAVIVGEIDAATLYGGHSDLSKTFTRYAARVCELCQAQFGETCRPERDEKCQAVMKAAVGRILAAHRTRTIDNLPAYLNGELKRLTHIGDLCGDDVVAELRHDRATRGTAEEREPQRLAGLADRIPAPTPMGDAE